ncbi:MipA/OmpV family protein [Sodalis sp. C49]|uniref:MipA/OmpV family protein n=1 Tax=Sodalis sp. C49 TaxID=3228929 RepID=UPI003965ACFB
MNTIKSRLIEIKYSRITLALTFAYSVLWIPPTAALEANPAEVKSSRLSLGIGAAVVQKAYRDIDPEVLPIPIISYENRWLDVSVPRVDLKIYSTDSFSMRLRARYAGDGYDADDSPFLQGMADRKGSIWAGGAMTYDTTFARLSAEVLADMSGYSEGYRAKLAIDRRFSSGAFGITPRLGIEWVDSKFVDYYYGVKSAETRPGREFYEGKSTANVDIGVRLDYRPAVRHMLFIDAGATLFGSAIKDSPLVDSSTQTMLGIGYVYRF